MFLRERALLAALSNHFNNLRANLGLAGLRHYFLGGMAMEPGLESAEPRQTQGKQTPLTESSLASSDPEAQQRRT